MLQTEESVSVLIAGPPGIGKSGCVVRALGRSAFWIVAERGGLFVARNPEVNPAGEVPDHVGCYATQEPFAEVLQAVRVGCAGVRAGRYSAIVLDTLSSFADRDMDYIRATIRTGHGREWVVLGEHIRMVINEALASGAVLIAVCHYETSNEFHGARPRLPGKMGSEAVPSLFDIVLRCEMRAGGNGMPQRVFRREVSDPLWKDRLGVVVDGEPMDLRSVLRRAMQRARGLPVDEAPKSLIDGAGGGAEGAIAL